MRALSRLIAWIAALHAAGLAAACAGFGRAAPSELAQATDIDRAVEQGLETLGVQGLALAIYAPEGVYAKGFGFADMETGAPVGAETAFYIASSTKSFTALAMNVLHHRGEIDLDATLAKFAPEAPFSTEIQADEIRLRDLLTHTSGLDNEPISYRVAFTGQHDAETLWRLLAATRVRKDAPPGVFDYTNVGYNILTILTDRVIGRDWRDILAEEIFDKAGMMRTSAYMSKAVREGWSLARPHVTVGADAPRRLHMEKTDATMHSAGGLIMSASDAARWLELMIEDGRVAGEAIVPAAAVRETRAPFAKVDGEFGEYARDHYGLGWHIGRYRGDEFVHHFGGFAGARSHVSYMPGRRIGVAVFVNDSGAGFRFADVLANYIYDLLLGRTDAGDRFEIALADAAAHLERINAAIAADREKRAARAWTLTLPRAAYAGRYENELFGAFELVLEPWPGGGEALMVSLGNLRAIAEPFVEPDTIRVELVPERGEVIAFLVEDAGEVSGLRYHGEVFVRR